MLSNLDYGLLLALVLPFFAIIPLLLHAGLPNTADGPVHLMRQVELNQAWQQGNFYPRWGTDLALGHGMPIFSYAPPALYQLTQLFHLTGLSLDAAMKAVLILDFLLYSVGMFLFARRIYGPAPALVAAAVYVYAPYRLREAYIQGNYGQFTGLAFYPLIFWAFHGLITTGRARYLVAGALSLAALLLSHNISFMLFAPLFAAYLLFLLILVAYPGVQQDKESAQEELVRNTPDEIRNTSHTANGPPAYRITHHAAHFIRRLSPPLLRTIAAGLLGLGLAAIFWLPAFGERHQIKLEGITQGFFDFRENFIPPAELISPPLPLDLAAINPEFPLSLGLPQLLGAALAILGLGFLIVKWAAQPLTRVLYPTQDRPVSPPTPHAPRLPHTLFFSFFFLLYAFLALPASQALWETIPMIELTEFPWRMLGPAIFCASVLSAATFALLTPGSRHPTPRKTRPGHAPRLMAVALLLVIFVVIALNAYYLYPSQFIPWGTPTPADAFAYEVASGAIGTTSTGEFLPRAAQQHPQPQTLWPDYAGGRLPQKIDPASLPPGADVEILSHLAESDAWRINTPQEARVTIRTLYWPGWQLYLDGQPAPFTVTGKTGLIETTIPPGQHTLTLQLESTPLRTSGRGLTIIAFLVLVVLVGLLIYRRRSQASEVRSTVGDQDQSPMGISARFFVIAVVLLVALYLVSRPLAPLFTLQSDPNQPQPADRNLRVDFAGQLRLVGMDHLPEAIEAGTTLSAVLYWRALQDLDANYSVFLHLDAPGGQTLATVDEVNPADIPTRNWPPGLYLRNPLSLEIPTDLPPIRYEVNVGVYNRASGERLSVASDETTYKIGSVWVVPTQPELTGPILAHFGPHISLWQADFDGESLGLVWETKQPLAQDHNIFIHLLDADGNLLAQADGRPYAGLYPLPNWRPHQLIADTRPLGALLQNPAQLQAIAIGIYDPVTGERLTATDPAGNPLPDHSFILKVTP